jgi:hypothetical protein
MQMLGRKGEAGEDISAEAEQPVVDEAKADEDDLPF